MSRFNSLFKHTISWDDIKDDNLSFIDTCLLYNVNECDRIILKMQLIERLKEIAVYHKCGSTYIHNDDKIIKYGNKLLERLNGINNIEIMFKDFQEFKHGLFSDNTIISFLTHKIDDSIIDDPDYKIIQTKINDNFESFNSNNSLKNDELFLDITTIQNNLKKYFKSGKTVIYSFENIINMEEINEFINTCKLTKDLLSDYKDMVKDSLIFMLYYKIFFNHNKIDGNYMIRTGITGYTHCEIITSLYHNIGNYFFSDKNIINPMLKINLCTIDDIETERLNCLYKENE